MHHVDLHWTRTFWTGTSWPFLRRPWQCQWRYSYSKWPMFSTHEPHEFDLLALANHLPTTWCKLKDGIKHIQRESDKSSEASRLASLGATNQNKAGHIIRSQSRHSMKCFFSVWCWCKTARNLKRDWTLHQWQGQEIETSYDFKTLTSWKWNLKATNTRPANTCASAWHGVYQA